MKTRLLGAAVLIALAVIFVPMFFSSNPTPPGGDKNVSLDIPAETSADMQTRTMDLTTGATSSSSTVAAVPPAAGATAAAAASPPPVAQPQPQPAVPQPAPGGPVIPHNSGGLARVDIQSRRPSDVETGAGSEPVIADRRRHPAPAPTSEPAAAPPTRSPATAPVAATASQATHGHYSLNLSAYASSASARSLIGRVQALGYPAQARPITQGGRTLALVSAGPFESRAAAEAARLKIVQSVPGVPARLQTGASDQTGDAAAPTPKAAAASTPAASRAGGWAVQLAAMGAQADANALRDRLRSQGFDAYVDSVNVSGKRLWRVRAGPQTQRADAARIREAIRSKLGMAGNIVSAP